MTEIPNGVKFSFSLPRTSDDHVLCVIAQRGNARLHVDFEDDGGEGTRELWAILKCMPAILSTARDENTIKRSALEVDQDLLDLLSEGDPDD